MKKIWFNIKLFLHYLMQGLHSADTIITSQEKDSLDGSTIEQKKEIKSVYADLLRGEVTQEVKELRHEMYYAERLSKEYDYGGNGRAVKKNNLFKYNGNIEQSDGYNIQLIQENKEDLTLLGDFVNVERNFTIKIIRDFYATLRIEEFTTKVVVKRMSKDKVLLDLYTPIYPKQFDRRSRIFVNNIEKIYMGDVRSDIIDFSGLNFVSYNAYNSDDLKEYEYNNIKFELITKFDGSYVLRFSADIVKDGVDMITEFYDEKTAKKNENHEMREGAVIDYTDAVAIQERDNYDAETAEKLMNSLK